MYVSLHPCHWPGIISALQEVVLEMVPSALLAEGRMCP